VNFLQDLRRRRMFRLIGLYIVGAWVVIQVAQAAFEAWGVPDEANRYVWIAAALCFPIALIFGWIYDITNDGIVRTRKAAPGEEVDLSLRQNDYVILVALLTIGVIVLIGSVGQIIGEVDETTAAAKTLDKSIAVLPFDSLDLGDDTAVFSDGVTEEILHRLSSLRSLHVIGRTSSFAFRGAEDGPARVAELIGVRYLLHGTVRRDNDQVRVTARLTDENGHQVWSQSFDRKLEGIFSIQSEIASTVSGQVLNEIVPLSELPAGRTTENMDAYNHYLVGRSYYNSRTPGWQAKAEEAFLKAIEVDDGFAPPYAGLAIAKFVTNPDGDHDAGREAVEKALSLDPDLPEALAIYGLYLEQLDKDYAGAIASLRRAIELDPSFSQAYNWLAIALDQSGKLEESDRVQELGLSVDPMNPPLVVNVAARYSREGDPERARQLVSRLTNLPEPPGLVYWELMSLETDYGRHDEAAIQAFETIRGYANTHNAGGYSALAYIYERLGLSDRSEYWMGVHEEQEANPMTRQMRKLYWYRQRGDWDATKALIDNMPLPPEPAWPGLNPFVRGALTATHVSAGYYDKAIRIFTAAGDPDFDSYSKELGLKEAMDFTHGLAVAYFRTGQDQTAKEVLNQIRKVMEAETAIGTSYPPVLQRLSQTYLLLEDFDKAVSTLRRALDLGWSDYIWIATDPTWDAVADRPDFQEILDEMRMNMERQRAHIESVHDEEAFRVEIQQLLAN
jgi:TolB-like protein/Tfp pilus assembly protein PilF